MRDWILNHDESWIFTALYIGSAVVLSIAISLFWLLAVLAAHFAIEWIRQRACAPQGVFWRTAWHLKLDLALVLLALVLAVYMEMVLGVLGLGGAIRIAAQAGPRMAGWSRVLRGVLLSVDDMAQVARAASRLGKKSLSREERPVAETQEDVFDLHPWRHPKLGDRVAIFVGVGSLALILMAPLLLPEMSSYRLLEIMAEEFHPFPR
jgi:hypothetical protein